MMQHFCRLATIIGVVVLGATQFASFNPAQAQWLSGTGAKSVPADPKKPLQVVPAGEQTIGAGLGLGTSSPTAGDADPSDVPGKRTFSPPEAFSPPSISWRVENPFRFFKDASDTRIHRATWDALSLEQRKSPVLSAERALSGRLRDGWASRMYGRTCWNADTNKTGCGNAGEAFSVPEHHYVLVTLDNVEDAGGVMCTWLTAPASTSKLTRGEAVTKACDQPVRVKIPYPDGATVEVEIGGRRVAKASVEVSDLLVVGMGDSFGSGEGNPDLPVRFSRERSVDYGNGKKGADSGLQGYPARVGSWGKLGDEVFAKNKAMWIDTACHRSLYSHQLRAALQLAIEEPHRAVTFVGLACSGAEVTFGLFLRYKGNEWVPNPPEFSQISAAAQAQCGKTDTRALDLPEAYHIRGTIKELEGGLVLHKCPRRIARKIDLLLVSVGGNDIGFARMLANAILSDKSMLRNLGGWMGQVHGRDEARFGLRSLDERYKSLNRAFHNLLHIPWRQSDRIVLTAYPSMALLGDGSKVCPGGNAGMEVAPEFALASSQARESHLVAEELNGKMKRSARSHGWSFVDGHRKQFIGRGVCAGYVDHAFSTADDLRLPRKVDGKWVPYNPSTYRAYASRQRWFRTPNDAFLTGNFHVSASIMQKVLKFKSLRWFQLLLAATYSGAFHPSAEGQAAMADAVVVKARGVLEKYGQ